MVISYKTKKVIRMKIVCLQNLNPVKPQLLKSGQEHENLYFLFQSLSVLGDKVCQVALTIYACNDLQEWTLKFTWFSFVSISVKRKISSYKFCLNTLIL